MLALKKKREKERKAAEEAAKAAAASPGADAPADAAPAEKAADGAPTAGGQVSLFGIGGQKKTKKGESGTKKTPGEIRIQKGMFLVIEFYFAALCFLFLEIEQSRLGCTIDRNCCDPFIEL